MKYLANMGNDSFTVEVDEDKGHTRVNVAGTPMHVDLIPVDSTTTYSLLIDGRSYTATLVEMSDIWRVMIDGVVYEIEVEAADVAKLRRAIKRHTRTGPQIIKAPMPGRVIAVEVEVGDSITDGQGIVIIEAMKMENELRAHAPGRVKEVRVRAGDAVNKGDVLVVVEGEQ